MSARRSARRRARIAQFPERGRDRPPGVLRRRAAGRRRRVAARRATIGITAPIAPRRPDQALLQTKIDEQLRPEQAAERRRREDPPMQATPISKLRR